MDTQKSIVLASLITRKENRDDMQCLNYSPKFKKQESSADWTVRLLDGLYLEKVRLITQSFIATIAFCYLNFYGLPTTMILSKISSF